MQLQSNVSFRFSTDRWDIVEAGTASRKWVIVTKISAVLRKLIAL